MGTWAAFWRGFLVFGKSWRERKKRYQLYNFSVTTRDRVSGRSGRCIIYAKWNSEEVYLKNYRLSSKIRKDRRLQSWQLEKKLLNFPNREFLYRKSYSKFDAFWGLSINLVVFFEWSTLKPSIFVNFWWKSIFSK